MTTLDFSPLFRSTVGFDRLSRLLETGMLDDQATSYPPYNIVKLSEDEYRITMAVAGFGEEDIEIISQDNQITVQGRQKERANKDGVTYLHRGIAARQFQRSFVLADGIEVMRAELGNGLLHIDLHRPRPEPQVRNIAINTTDGGRSDTIGVGGKPGTGRA